jgi:hypothetical protein
MPFLLAFGFLAVVLMWTKRGHASLGHPLPPAPPRPPGMPPEAWPEPPRGPGSLAVGPPTCASNQWQLPDQKDVPQDVTNRSVQILRSPAPMGTQLVERAAGGVWRYQVETHGANEMNPKPHRGVGVRRCQ